MAAVVMRLRSEFRGRWRSWAGLALIIAVFVGAVLGAVAASRRTDSAYRRFLAVTNPYDHFLLGDIEEPFAPVRTADVRGFPQVEEVIEVSFFATTAGEVIASADPRLDRTFNRAKVVKGVFPTRADEIAVPVAIEEQIGARVGGKMTITFIAAGSDERSPTLVPMTFTIAAVIAEPGEFPPESDLGPPRLHLTPAFFRANNARLLSFPFLLVWLHNGPADLPAFRAAMTDRYRDKPVIGFTQAALTKNVDRSFRLQATSLGLFAFCLGLVTLLVLGQALGRQALAEGIDHPSLRSLGMTRRQLFALGLARVALIAIAGLVLAVVVALGLSPLTPTGLARAAEPSPGFAVDATAIGLGAVVTFGLLLLVAFVPVLRAARGDTRLEAPDRGSRAAAFAARAGAPASTVVGIRLALEPGRGRTAVPVRTTILGVALAIAAVVVSLGFGESLRHLLRTPRLYGVTWSAVVALGDDETSATRLEQALDRARRHPDVEAARLSGLGVPIVLDERIQADGMLLPAGDRTFIPPILEGRAPRAVNEIALGPKTLEQIDRGVGDTVGVGANGVKPTPMKIVGRAIIPTVGHTANLGEGSFITFDSIRAFAPGVTDIRQTYDEFAVRFRPGVDQAAARARLARTLEDLGAEVLPPLRPADLLNFGRNKNLPYLLAGMLAALALATLGHAMFSSVNRRRRDLAVLKTIGFTRRDTRMAVAWQSTTFIVVSLTVGLLIGVAAGRWLWTRYAENLGIIAEPRVPALILLAIIPVGILVANALALLPGRTAARTRPALVLRTE